MFELLQLFFDICRFKKGPQDIPPEKGVLYLLIPIYAGISFLAVFLSASAMEAIQQVFVEIVLLLSLTKIILFVAGKQSRYYQTASALVGTDTIISFCAIPVLATFLGQGSVNSAVALVLLMGWSWLVSGKIFSEALGLSFPLGLSVALLYILAFYQVSWMLFPEISMLE